MPSFSMLTLNVNGISMGNAFGKLLHEADRWKKKGNLAVLCIQEHNLKPSEEGDIRTQAVLRGYSLAISFEKTDDPNDRQAGVLILTNNKLVSFKKTNVCKPGIGTSYNNVGG